MEIVCPIDAQFSDQIAALLKPPPPQEKYFEELLATRQCDGLKVKPTPHYGKEFIEKCGFRVVKQLLITGPTGTYYLLEDDSSIRTLQTALSSDLQLFVVDEGETTVLITNICDLNKPYHAVPVEVGGDSEPNEEDEVENEPIPSGYNSDELEVFRKEKSREINDKLDKFLELENGMCFKDLKEAKRIVSFYSIIRKVALKVDKSDSIRLRYLCDIGCPFECLISEDRKNQGFKIKTLNTNHSENAFKNRRATQEALAHYLKKKLQNNPKYKVKDMRQDLDDNFNLNVSYSKTKRVKRLVLEKLEGSYIDEFNKLEGYAQELRDNNPSADVIINISREALEQGKKKILKNVCVHSSFNKWLERRFETIYRVR
ncbi:hypothetical protein MTR67_032440 [Solanum verrucosum]|uniref:Transposase MuDR plant domain-containing protein n=1 Tax=Solanum verrucosum TaxID=315347 RepID=A0AAF0U493_SOLVR|nr:hypothetical protein MTR67_032440 [Solanum verrucosum]